MIDWMPATQYVLSWLCAVQTVLFAGEATCQVLQGAVRVSG